MSVEASLPWPSNLPELKRLDELLRCGICYEFMSTAMVTCCSHNYCSLCIRQYLGYKTQCPACFQETTSQQLRNNRLLDEIITLFPNLRDKIARQAQSSKGKTIAGYLLKEEEDSDGDILSSEAKSSSPEARSSSSEAKSSSRKMETLQSPSQRSSTMEHQFSPRPTKTPLLDKTPKRSFGSTPLKSPLLNSFSPSPSSSRMSNGTLRNKALVKNLGGLSPSQSSVSSAALTESGRQTASGFFSIQNDRSPAHTTSVDEQKVSCPVCNVMIPERNINLHLDACLKRMEEGQKDDIICVSSAPKRKPLPKLVYSLLNEKQMRQKLKEIGLSIQGDKQQLVSRHRKYTTLYNAECDVESPRSIQELLRQVDREEKEESKATTTRSVFSYDRKTAPEVIEKEQISYIKKNNNHFSKLIADVQKRQQEGKKKKEAVNKEEPRRKEVMSATPGTSNANPIKKSNNKKWPSSSTRTVLSDSDESDNESAKGFSNSRSLASDMSDSEFRTTKLLDKESDIPRTPSKNLVRDKNEQKNSILNFFQNSPKKPAQSFTEKCASVSEQNIMKPNKEDSTVSPFDNENFGNVNSFVKVNGKIDDKESTCSSNSTKLTPTGKISDKQVFCNGVNEEQPLTNGLKSLSNNGGKMEEEMSNCSDDFFASDADSSCSNASESLLKDQDVFDDDDFPDTVPYMNEEVDHKIEDGNEEEEEEEEELIPCRQPESCQLENSQERRTPSPTVGRRVTRRSAQPSQPQQNLSMLGPETQDLDCESQLTDPEYQPSQKSEDFDEEESGSQTTRKSRRMMRKRQVNDEVVEAPKRPRRRK